MAPCSPSQAPQTPITLLTVPAATSDQVGQSSARKVTGYVLRSHPTNVGTVNKCWLEGVGFAG